MEYQEFNELTQSELITIEGIGKTTAKRIAAMRPFRSSDDLFKVNGLGKRTLNRLGIMKSTKPRKRWYNIEGKDYPQSAVAKDERSGIITFFWRIPREYRIYLELESSTNK
jgi:hypothetical protein